MKTCISWTKVGNNVIVHDHEEVLIIVSDYMTFKWPDVTFTDTKCMRILKMKLIIIVMIKDVRHFQKYDYDVINCSLDWTES